MRPHSLIGILVIFLSLVSTSDSYGEGWVLVDQPFGDNNKIGTLNFQIDITSKENQPFSIPTSLSSANKSSFIKKQDSWSYVVKQPGTDNTLDTYQYWREEKAHYLVSKNALFKVKDGQYSGTNCNEDYCYTASPGMCAKLKSVDYFHKQSEINELETELIQLQNKKNLLLQKKSTEAIKKELVFIQDQILKKRSQRDLYNFNNNFGHECASLLRESLQKYREMLKTTPALLSESGKHTNEINKVRSKLTLQPLKDLSQTITGAEFERALDYMDKIFNDQDPKSLGWQLREVSLMLQNQLRDCEMIGWHNQRSPTSSSQPKKEKGEK